MNRTVGWWVGLKSKPSKTRSPTSVARLDTRERTARLINKYIAGYVDNSEYINAPPRAAAAAAAADLELLERLVQC